MPDERVQNLGAPERRRWTPSPDIDVVQCRGRLCVERFTTLGGPCPRVRAYYEGRCVVDTDERRGVGQVLGAVELGRRVHKWSSVYRDSMLAQKARAEC